MKSKARNAVRTSEGESPKPEWELIGKRLVSIRGSTLQPEMAAKLGVSKTTYGRLERGAREVGADVLQAIARAGWGPLWVLTGEGSERISEAAHPGAAVDTALIVARENAPVHDFQGKRLNPGALGIAAGLLNDLLAAMRSNLAGDDYATKLLELAETVQTNEKAVPTKVIEISRFIAQRNE